jgi:predicted nucleic-acid-binding Zn-ribbon protein
MSGEKKCPKCDGRMIRAEEEALGSFFGCTRNKKYIETFKGQKIASYLCRDCGYLEFYKEKKKEPRIEEAERKESGRKKALIRKEGQPPSVPSRERSYV